MAWLFYLYFYIELDEEQWAAIVIFCEEREILLKPLRLIEVEQHECFLLLVEYLSNVLHIEGQKIWCRHSVYPIRKVLKLASEISRNLIKITVDLDVSEVALRAKRELGR